MISNSTATDELIQRLENHVEELSTKIGERSVLRGNGLDQAKTYIHDAFKAAGLTVTEQAYMYNERRVVNLIADPPGVTTNSRPYIIGAHYDTVIGTPGADDNASAVAVMLELARSATNKPPEIPLRFVAFTLEEPPNHATQYQGSRVFVKQLIDNGMDISGAIILEMVGLTTAKQHYPLFLRWVGYPEVGNFIGVVGNRASKAFGKQVLQGMHKNPDLPVESLFVWLNGWILPDTRLSDHAPFWDKGFPALMITDTAYFRNKNYHGPNDTADTLDYNFMARLVKSLEYTFDELKIETPHH